MNIDINSLVMTRLLESTPNFGPSTNIGCVSPISGANIIITDKSLKKDKKNTIQNNSVLIKRSSSM